MRKKSTRFLSAALAACMMASVLPVSAFADGGTGSETGGDPQQGEVIKEFPREGGIIEEGGTYNLYEDYTGCLDLRLGTGGSAVINVTGNVHSEVQDAQDAVLLLRTGKVTINNMDKHEFTITGPTGGGGRCYYNGFRSDAKPETTINGGIYKCSSDNLETLFNYSGILRLNDVTSKADYADAVNNWATTYINGGEYDSDILTILNRQPYSYIEFDGNVRVHADHGRALCNVGTAVIRNGTYTNTSEDEPTIDTRKKMFVSGGTFKNTNTEQMGLVFSNVGELTIGGAGVQIENVGGTAYAVGNKGTLIFNNGTVTAPNGAAILNTSSTTNTGVTTINGGTLKDSKYGIQVSSGQVTLNDVTFSNNENDIYLRQDRMITIADSFTKRATVKVEDVSDGRRLTEGENEPGLNLVSNDPGYKVAYNETGKYYYLTPRTGYTLTAEKATATDGDDVVITPDDDINEGTPVTLTADEAPGGQKFADWTVTVDGDVRRDLLTFPNEEDHTTATFAMPKGNVTVKAEYEDIGDPVDPVDPSGEVDPVLTGAIVTGAVLVGAYEAGTGIYRLAYMRGIPLPSDRIELAELVWERAGKPEPESTALYSDISAEDTDAQKAARWAVEQELLKDDTNEDEQKFHPAFPVSKLRVCLTWEKAKQKGLFDQNTEA